MNWVTFFFQEHVQEPAGASRVHCVPQQSRSAAYLPENRVVWFDVQLLHHPSECQSIRSYLYILKRRVNSRDSYSGPASKVDAVFQAYLDELEWIHVSESFRLNGRNLRQGVSMYKAEPQVFRMCSCLESSVEVVRNVKCRCECVTSREELTRIFAFYTKFWNEISSSS